jgi:glycosyltransferase involved in cell wall biosynthesis
MQNPLVSAVIPTRNRSDLVMRAVKSALTQTYLRLEVVVVIDGPDSLTMAALECIQDHRLIVVPLPKSVGGSEARNCGVQHAQGEWIAFLDDDDEWMPDKIAKQVGAASKVTAGSPLICSQVIARTPAADFIWPETVPRRPYSEYLLVRSRLIYGEGLMQTSTLMAKRELLEQVPFRRGLRKHQDWDWVLRCTAREDVQVIFLPEPLAVWSLDQSRARVSQESLWRLSFDWIKQSRHLVTKRAYAGFLATYVAPQASSEKAWSAFFPLLWQLSTFGSPRWRDLGMFMGAWVVPTQLRHTFRNFVHAKAAVASRQT